MDNPFEQLTNISKAHAYDIVSKQVVELKESNAELVKALRGTLFSLERYTKSAVWTIMDQRALDFGNIVLTKTYNHP